jgi:hypothetical protein
MPRGEARKRRGIQLFLFGTGSAVFFWWKAGRVIGNTRETNRGPVTSVDSKETSHEED